jgi:DNA-directed RNA polymerase specialized sigma subunit, sigma24 homolog
MDAQHPNIFDKRPKRRKDKDNPYELFTVGFGTPEPLYFIRFKDGQEIEHCMEIQKSLFDLLDSFELEDLRFLNEQDRHYDLREPFDPQLQEQSAAPDVEETVLNRIQYKDLYKAINTLTAIQRRRIILYYFGGFTMEEIANQEGISFQKISRSIQKAEKKLKKFLIGG